MHLKIITRNRLTQRFVVAQSHTTLRIHEWSVLDHLDQSIFLSFQVEIFASTHVTLMVYLRFNTQVKQGMWIIYCWTQLLYKVHSNTSLNGKMSNGTKHELGRRKGPITISLFIQLLGIIKQTWLFWQAYPFCYET